MTDPAGGRQIGVDQHVGTVETGATVIGVQFGLSAEQLVEVLIRKGVLRGPAPVFPEALFRQLLEILGREGLPSSKTFARIYHATLPPTAHVVNNENASDLLVDLCEQQRVSGKGWPPLFEFVERLRLAEGILPARAAELQQWVDSNAALLSPPVPAAEIERLRRDVLNEKHLVDSRAPSWLQIYLEPDWLNRTQERKQLLFRVELVLWSPLIDGPLVLESDPAAQDSSASKQLWSLDELPALLDQVFASQKYLSHIPDLRSLLIEIVAPSTVLLYGFERWKRNKSADTYGVFHPMVVRLRDRLTIPYPADQKLADEYWRQKWEAFQGQVCLNGCEELPWCMQDELDVFDMQDDDNLVCLGLASPLYPEQQEFFDKLRDSGIPIAIWLRGVDLDPGAPADLPERVKALLQGKPLAELYETVKAVRRLREVRKDEKHIGNALTLLWDDPYRVPKKYHEQGAFV